MEEDDKWKLSKKGRSRSGRAHHLQQHAMIDAGELSRSYSASVSSTRRTNIPLPPTNSRPQQALHQETASVGLSKKCVEAVKEHRARFYIVRRCVSMLVCWRDH